MMVELDLFGPQTLPGLTTGAEIITRAEEAELIARIDAEGLSPFRFQGWLGKRLTRSFGWSYDFDTGRFAPTDPIPEWLRSVQARAATFAGLAADELVQALLIRYDPGAGIGWHKDRPVFEHVVGISLGAPATMRFRRRAAKGFERVAVPLASRSIYHLTGEIRHEWEHSIVPIEQPRWSVTFRSLARTDERSGPLPPSTTGLAQPQRHADRSLPECCSRGLIWIPPTPHQLNGLPGYLRAMSSAGTPKATWGRPARQSMASGLIMPTRPSPYSRRFASQAHEWPRPGTSRSGSG
jgi:alkylated DNA repair protein (DNA oxidative demethylase)